MSRNGGWSSSSFPIVNCILFLVVKFIEVIQKFCQLFLAMEPDDESVVYISEPAYRFVCRLF
jgi:hypothetical protein